LKNGRCPREDVDRPLFIDFSPWTQTQAAASACQGLGRAGFVDNLSEEMRHAGTERWTRHHASSRTLLMPPAQMAHSTNTPARSVPMRRSIFARHGTRRPADGESPSLHDYTAQQLALAYGSRQQRGPTVSRRRRSLNVPVASWHRCWIDFLPEGVNGWRLNASPTRRLFDQRRWWHAAAELSTRSNMVLQ